MNICKKVLIRKIMKNNRYNLVAENPQSTVVAEYYKLADISLDDLIK